MKTVNMTDHQLAKFIKDNSLVLRSSEGCTLGTDYYNNNDLSVELLIVFNNSTMEKQIYIIE